MGKGMRRRTIASFVVIAAVLSACSIAKPSPEPATSTTPPATTWSLDHVVIVVASLDDAVSQYRSAGFTVTLGGQPAGDFDENALIPFQDGTYLELYAPIDPASFKQMSKLVTSGEFDQAMAGSDAITKRFALHVADGPGLADVAVTRPNLEPGLAGECESLSRSGVQCVGPIAMSRVLPNGTTARWEVDVLTSPSLPFLIADVTARTVRVPEGPARIHANGATGIESITLDSTDPRINAESLAKVFGTPPGTGPNNHLQFTLPAQNREYAGGPSTVVCDRAGTPGPSDLVLRTSRGRARHIRLGAVGIALRPE